MHVRLTDFEITLILAFLVVMFQYAKTCTQFQSMYLCINVQSILTEKR